MNFHRHVTTIVLLEKPESKSRGLPPSGKKNLKRRKHSFRSKYAEINSKGCTDKPYCSTVRLDNKICDAVSQVQNDCPISCQRCNPCKDDNICHLISNVKTICKSRPTIQELCPRTCQNCPVETKEIGELKPCLSYLWGVYSYLSFSSYTWYP